MKFKILKYCKKNKTKIFKLINILVNLRLLFIFKEKDKNIIMALHKLQNICVYVKRNGKKIYNKKFKNIQLKIRGINNYVEIHEPKSIKDLKIYITGSNSKFYLASNAHIHELTVYLSQNSEIKIGNDFSIRNGSFTVSGDIGNKITIGNDCMLSYDLIIRTHDTHIIYDKNTKQLLNSGKDIKIGNHVWIAARSMILKGSEIPDNSIVGAASIVTKKFTEPNCIIAGNPAKVVKKDINWHRARIHKWNQIKDSLID